MVFGWKDGVGFALGSSFLPVFALLPNYRPSISYAFTVASCTLHLHLHLHASAIPFLHLFLHGLAVLPNSRFTIHGCEEPPWEGAFCVIDLPYLAAAILVIYFPIDDGKHSHVAVCLIMGR